MLQEFSVNNHVVGFHTSVLVLNVLGPKSVIVVKVVNGLDVSDLLDSGLNFMYFCVGFAVEVSHATFNFRLYLKVRNSHFLF